MFKNLYWKLAIAFVLVAFITAALVGVFIRINSTASLMRLIIDQQRSNMEETLSEFYSSQGSWNNVSQNWEELQRESNPNPAPPQPNDTNHDNKDRRNLLGLADASGTVIVQVDPNFPVGSKLPEDVLSKGTAIVNNGSTVGTILTATRLSNFNPEESLFLDRTNRALMMGIAAAMLVAIVIGIVLARTLTNPLKELTRATEKIAEGHLEQQVNIHTKDEIGQLAKAFNIMSQEVARVNNMRKQMTADIAHDLRTPLTVIGGYIESMRDGVLQPTPERLTIIYTEIERLQKLVGDLRILSQADSGELPLNLERISPVVLIGRSIQLFQHQAEQQGIHLDMQTSGNLPDINVDQNRMMQVMDNLLSNAFRYTPSGGEILVEASQRDHQVSIKVSDTGTGIEAEDLPYIFDRFRRADKSRHTETGESGLGLAIVKALVETHHGHVWAESNPGTGTVFTILLPAAD